VFLRDFRTLPYSIRDGGSDTRGFCPTLQLLHIAPLGGAADVRPVIKFSHTLHSLGRPVLSAAHRQPLCSIFLYHPRIVLSVRCSVWSLVRNLRCAVTIDSVIANSKTQNAFLSPILAMFSHDCLLAVKPASTPCRLLTIQHQEILQLLTCFSLLCLSCCSAEFASSGGSYELPSI
jgi:hypothetical protein